MKATLVVIAVVSVSAPLAGAQPPATMEEQVVELVNQERWDNGQLPPLKHNALLDAASEGHSTAMGVRDFFAHCDLDYSTSPWDRMVAAGYTYNWAGENIAAGYADAPAVMNGWMNSSGHRANILNTNFREVGVGYYYQTGDASTVRRDTDGDCSQDGAPGGPYYRYWTQNFGAKSSVYPVVINREAHVAASHQVELYAYGSGWAAEMRFSNNGELWSGWEPFDSQKTWFLEGEAGPKTVFAEIRNGGGTVKSAQDQIHLSTAVVGVGDQVPDRFAASHARPNPFRAGTQVQFSLPAPEHVSVHVFDVSGRLMRTLAENPMSEGTHSVTWDGVDTRGVRVPEGVYFVRIQAGLESRVVKTVHRR